MRKLFVLLAVLTACNGDDTDNPTSTPTEPTIDFQIDPPDVDTDWPLDTGSDTDPA